MFRTEMKIDKKRLIFALAFTAVLVILSICMLITSIKNGYDYENNSRMFESMSDLAFLDELVTDENSKDNNIKNISYKDSKVVKIQYNNREICIYAYDFSTVTECQKYARNVSGNDYQDIEAHSFYKHTSFLNIIQSEELLVFCNDKAYVISAKIPETEFNEFMEYFMNQLPTVVQMDYPW